ncbi:hypothetical protein ACFL6S_10380 [Candidatus Poribacteria bacterium]
MKIYRDALFCTLLLFTIIASRAFPVAFEEREPRDEKAILVPRGARPMLKEEYPRRELVVERIKARHTPSLIIPFVRSWNTAALTVLRGIEMEETPELDPNDFELGFALHSQRMRVGALRNREYFQRETEGFPERWYRPLDTLRRADQSTGYMSTSFVHIAARRSRRTYMESIDFTDRISGILNAIMAQNKQFTLTAHRDMQDFRGEGTSVQPRVKNAVGMFYKRPSEYIGDLEVQGDSTWSTLTDSVQRDFRYISGTGSVGWGRNVHPDLDIDAKLKFQISTLRDQTESRNAEALNTRKSGWLEMLNTLALAKHLKLKLNASALYDSEYKFFATPSAELAIVPWQALQMGIGIRRRAILPDHDEIYWPSRFVKVNDDLQPEDFWEGFGLFKVDIVTRVTFRAEAFYSRADSRITWEQLPGYVWEPRNVETSESFTGQAFLTLNLIGSLNTFASFRYQRFEPQRFDPEIVADGGFSYGNPVRGAITLGASYWNFQPLEDMDNQENLSFVYGRINKSIRRVVSIFIDARYTFKDESVRYYRGMPQAGRMVSVGANMVFGGLE